MRLYEYEGKLLLRRYKIPTPEGVVIGDRRELAKVTYPAVVKAQVLAGGRGKAGAIMRVSSESEAQAALDALLGTRVAGFLVERVLVERACDIAHEYYVAAMIDRLAHAPLLIASASGGVEIEEVARTNPTAIIRRPLAVGEMPESYYFRSLATELGFAGDAMNQAAGVLAGLYRLFLGLDCKLVEVNPLVLTRQGRVLALDAKVDLDEDGMFRHPELKELGIEARHEVGELTPREKLAKAAGFPYVDLDGDIGTFPGGAGFGIACLDLIRHYGGQPANFMDSGGAPTQERLRQMLGILLDNPRVKVIFGARFGGISRCDDWARAVVQYVIENKPAKPMVMRMAGNMDQEGRQIFEAARAQYPALFARIKVYAYDTPIEDVIKEAIRVAREE